MTHDLEGDVTLEARPGEPFAVATKEAGGAGYQWSVEAGPGVEHVGTERRPADGGAGTVGGGTLRVDTFVCREAGTHAVAMHHARPWLADDGKRTRITIVCGG